jgi:hypothetical protein
LSRAYVRVVDTPMLQGLFIVYAISCSVMMMMMRIAAVVSRLD